MEGLGIAYLTDTLSDGHLPMRTKSEGRKTVISCKEDPRMKIYSLTVDLGIVHRLLLSPLSLVAALIALIILSSSFLCLASRLNGEDGGIVLHDCSLARITVT